MFCIKESLLGVKRETLCCQILCFVYTIHTWFSAGFVLVFPSLRLSLLTHVKNLSPRVCICVLQMWMSVCRPCVELTAVALTHLVVSSAPVPQAFKWRTPAVRVKVRVSVNDPNTCASCAVCVVCRVLMWFPLNQTCWTDKTHVFKIPPHDQLNSLHLLKRLDVQDHH